MLKRANRRFNRLKRAESFLKGAGGIERVIARKLPDSFISRAFRRFEMFSQGSVNVIDDITSKRFMILTAFNTLQQLVDFQH
mmetsp:Transcript_32817/g.57250  ORF Transcript_32817/g.57250 Transcript_32817/m.57250 type:complete len:82 (+) Transcript_32817:3425-3670(+)